MSQFPVWNKNFFTYSQCPVFYSQKVSHFGFCMNEFLECLVNLVYGFLSYASFLPISFVTRRKLYNSSLKWAVHGNYTAPSGVLSGIHKSLTRPLITAACSDCHRQIPGPEWLWSTCQHKNIFSCHLSYSPPLQNPQCLDLPVFHAQLSYKRLCQLHSAGLL